jgi:hypothetical protein
MKITVKYIDGLESLIHKLSFILKYTDDGYEDNKGSINNKIRNMTKKYKNELSVNEILKNYTYTEDIYGALIDNINYAIQLLESKLNDEQG